MKSDAHRNQWTGLGLLLGLALSACGGNDGSDGNGGGDDDDNDAWDTLKTTLDSYVPDTVNGYVFNLTVAGDSQFTRAGGNLDTGAQVYTASATKAPSAAAILTLVDDGLLDLDEPVDSYLQDSIDWPLLKRSITMRMLLNHTAGLAIDPDCLAETASSTMQDCVQEIANDNLLFLPGTGFAYGGGSYQVAGYIATLLSGQTWQDFFRQALAQPLDMDHYEFVGEGNPRVAGGGLTTAEDYRHFQQMVLDGGLYGGRQVLSPAMIGEMTQDQIGGRIKYFSPLDQNDYPGYAFGWWIASPDVHPGSDGPELSDPGLFGSVPWIDLDLGYSAVLLIESNAENGQEIWDATRPLIIDGLTSE